MNQVRLSPKAPDVECGTLGTRDPAYAHRRQVFTLGETDALRPNTDWESGDTNLGFYDIIFVQAYDCT